MMLLSSQKPWALRGEPLSAQGLFEFKDIVVFEVLWI